MRLLALNVGMPAVERAADVAAAMLAAAPDIVVLAEVAKGEAARLLRDTLKAGGLGATVKGHLDPPAIPHTVAVASRAEHAAVRRPFDGGPWASCALEVELGGIVLVAVHAPEGQWTAFRDAALAPYLATLVDRRAVVAGTFADDGTDPDLAGWIDAVAVRHPASREGTVAGDLGGGATLRVDRVLVSTSLAGAVTDAFILQAPREVGLTAHAAVVVDLDLQLRP